MKLKNALILALISSLVGFDTAFAVAENPLEQFRLAGKAYKNKRFDTALQEYSAFLKTFPKHKLADQSRFALGEINFALKKYPEAAKHYTLLRKSSGRSYEGLNASLRLGQCEFNMKKYIKALDHFIHVKEHAPKALRSEAILGMGLSYMALRDFPKAEDVFNDLLQSYPKYKTNTHALIPLSLIHLSRGNLQNALDLLANLPDDTGAQFYRGVALRKMGRTIAASQMFKDVYEADLNGFWADKAQLQMAEAYYEVNEYNLAYDSFRKVYEKYEFSTLRPYALHRMASINFQLGRFQEAGLKWDELVRTFEENVNMPYATYMLGEMALRQGENSNAIMHFSKIPKAHELGMDAQYKILWCLAAQKQDETAVTKADQFIKAYPWGELAANAHIIKGIALQRMKKYRDANEEYQIVLDHFGNSEQSEKAMYLMATSLFQNKQLAEIVTSLNSNLKESQVSPSVWQADTYLWVAEAYYGLKQFDASQRTFQLIVDNYKQSPKMAHAMLGVAASLAELGQYDQASIAHEQALALADTMKNPEVKRSVLLDTAQVLFAQKKYEKAMGYFDEFVKKYPDDALVPEALFQAGVCYYRLEYYGDAIGRWKQISANHPTHELAPKATFKIAKTQFGLGEYGQAVVQFEDLIARYPTYEKIKEARIQIAQSFYNEGQFDMAIEKLQEFLNNYPKDPKSSDVLELLQMAHYRKGKGGTDLALLTEKFPKSKLTAEIYWQLGAEAFNNNQFKQGLDYFQKLVGEFPEAEQVAKAYFFMAEAHFNLEEYAQAVTAYKNFALNFPQDDNRLTALFRLGVSHFQQNNFGEAVIAFNDVIEIDPQSPLSKDSLTNMAVSYKRMGQAQQALSTYERFLLRHPEDQERNKILIQMGGLNEELKNYEDALKNYAMVNGSEKEAMEALLSQGRIYSLLKLPNKQLGVYEKLRNTGPANHVTRLSGMVNLAELYHEMGKINESISVYEDIAQHSENPEWRQVATDRAYSLKSEIK